MTAPFVPMTKEDVAAVLMCTTRTVENLIKSGGIPTPTLLAGRVFWHPDVFYSWLDSSLRGGPGARDGDDMPVLDGECHQPKTRSGVKANPEGNSPASRMKAAQAARLSLPT